MEFDFVLKNLLEGFERLNIRYAAIGGFAMGLLGAPRATQDIDFLVLRDDLPQVDNLMTSLSYRKLFQSENVSQYNGETTAWGHVDFLHAFRPLALEMIAQSTEIAVPGASRPLRVLRPEHVIGLKIQALANNPDRKSRETADIESLVEARKSDLDWTEVEKFYKLFGLGSEFAQLRGRFHDAK